MPFQHVIHAVSASVSSNGWPTFPTSGPLFDVMSILRRFCIILHPLDSDVFGRDYGYYYTRLGPQ